MTGLILVTGAAGTLGKESVKQLLLSGAKVRAGIYNEKEAEKVNFAGAELVLFDFEKTETIISALSGVEKVLLITPFTDRMVDYTHTFIEFAKSAGIQHIVRISMMGADPNSPSIALKMHYECEEIVKNSGIPYTILRPNWFMQDFLNHAPTIKTHGTYHAPISTKGSISFVDARDVAQVCALALTGENSGGGTYILTGPQTFTFRAVEDNFAYILTKRVIFKEITDDEFRATMRGYGLSDWQINAFIELYDEAEKEIFMEIHPTTADIIGRKPETFKTFIKAYVKDFRQNA